jgi:hypothetical protein
MALVDDITAALQAGAQAGATAASSALKDLQGDVQTFVVPHLRDIAVQVASILQKYKDGIYTDVTAKDLLDSESDAIKTIIETITTLVVFEVQTILNAIMKALATAVNAAVGIVLL